MRTLRGLLTVAALALGACATVVPTTPTCATVCDRGAGLGCIWATPTPAGATCEQVCANAEAEDVPWKLACLAEATACDQVCR